MKKIMFNDRYGLTLAALEGIKTMTRRIATFEGIRNPMIANVMSEGPLFGRHCLTDGTKKIVAMSAYTLDEVVAVAQSYKDLLYSKDWVVSHIEPNPKAKKTDPFEKKYPGWNNKMYVKAEYMLHRIRIVDIKVERLQDIREEDALKEGIYYNPNPPKWRELDHYEVWHPSIKPFKFTDAKYYCAANFAFADLIDRVNGKGTWKRNPWVFVYSFKLIDQ